MSGTRCRRCCLLSAFKVYSFDFAYTEILIVRSPQMSVLRSVSHTWILHNRYQFHIVNDGGLGRDHRVSFRPNAYFSVSEACRDKEPPF